MKKFSNYNINNFENSLEEHFFVEYAIKESLNYSIYNILEKYGSYNGQLDLVYFLSKEIYKSNKVRFVWTKDKLKRYSNIFFGELIINISKNDTGYLIHKSTFNNETKLFDRIIINISNNDINNYHYIVENLSHELLHAYNEYQSCLHNSKIKVSDLVDQDLYQKTIFSIYNGEEFPRFACKRILNVIRKCEQNAYLSELNFVKIDSYKNAYKSFKESQVWTMYVSLWNYLNELYNEGTNKDKELFKTEYNEITNSNKSFYYIYKKLNSQFEKIFRKIEKTVPKIIYNKYANECISEKHNGMIIDNRHRYLIELLNFNNK